jgi:hypothetical protein
MNDFVEQCRAEWKRLRVPDPLADEMAADLAADFREAEADGVSAEEFLGSSVFDPRSFAASWAAERGIIPGPQSPPPPSRRRPRALVAFTVIAALALVVAALLLLTAQPTVNVAAQRVVRPQFFTPAGFVGPGPGPMVLHAHAAAPIEWMLLVLAFVAVGFAVWLWTNWGRARPGVPA